ncbi:nuclear transport factor 2 family protein [Eubacteriales bacterium OttesenSCG-928-N14]|nr:nuclear transport factor 2 family protein [Eubacteriales bacterium OttesenSCG-928-N14]
MKEREQAILSFFDAWLLQDSALLQGVLAEDILYREYWGAQYRGKEQIYRWFEEYNQRTRVLMWDVKHFWHDADVTIVQWYFKNHSDDGNSEECDGVSVVHFAADNTIAQFYDFMAMTDRFSPFED